jgi:hypothetical protein
MQVSNEHEAERAVKRLRTRIAIAQNAESSLATKQAHRTSSASTKWPHVNTAYRFQGAASVSECDGTIGTSLMDVVRDKLAIAWQLLFGR